MHFLILLPIRNASKHSGIGVAVALILENKAYNSRERKYGHLTSWAFNPQRLSWRRKSLRGGMDMLHAMMDF